jgi:hypothetical protein
MRLISKAFAFISRTENFLEKEVLGNTNSRIDAITKLMHEVCALLGLYGV